MPPKEKPLSLDGTIAINLIGGHPSVGGAASCHAPRRKLSDEDVEDLTTLKVFAEQTSGVEWSVEALAVLHGAFKGVSSKQ